MGSQIMIGQTNINTNRDLQLYMLILATKCRRTWMKKISVWNNKGCEDLGIRK